MKGTEKQVKWAEDIKAEFNKRILYCYGTTDENRAVISKALEYIDAKYDDARYWIEMSKRTYRSDLYCEVFAEMTADEEMQKLFR